MNIKFYIGGVIIGVLLAIFGVNVIDNPAKFLISYSLIMVLWNMIISPTKSK